jgi:hypothetical protein
VNVSPSDPANNLAARPAATAAVMTVMAHSTTLDYARLRLFVILMGGNATLAAKAFGAVRGGERQNVMRAIARSEFNDEEFVLFEAVVELTKAVRLHRHRLAHWTYHFAQSYADGFILHDPELIVTGQMKQEAGQVYDVAVLTELAAAFERVTPMWAYLGHAVVARRMLEGQGKTGADATNVKRDECLGFIRADPEIQAALAKLKKKAAT